MVLNRLISPKSKLGINKWKARIYGDMNNLVTRSAVVTLNGEPVTIHFSIWD